MSVASKFSPGQGGAALLLVMLVVVVGAATILVTTLNLNARRAHNVADTQGALVSAKSALLGFAVTYPDLVAGSPALLPCPDIDSGGATLDGESHSTNCGAAGESMLGRLPWKTLGVPALQDETAECLWYVVSGEYKDAASSTSLMINPDSNGQLQIFSRETGTIIQGAIADERPIALLIAARKVLGSQSRQSISQPAQQCSDDFNAASFLDADPGTGISNAVLTGGLDQFVVPATDDEFLNDRIVAISRQEYADAVYRRHDFSTRMSDLTSAIAKCVAAYGLSNPGGAGDRRLPWPAPVALADYRLDSDYDDTAAGVLSGRIPDIVNDSNGVTGNMTARVLSDCNPAVVPEWDSAMQLGWQSWKDHFFYYVGESYGPSATVPTACGNCITVNGAGQYAAVVLFSHERLGALGQVRDAPPLDTDTKLNIANYLEAANATSHPYSSGAVNLISVPTDSTFNDLLYCLDSGLSVVPC